MVNISAGIVLYNPQLSRLKIVIKRIIDQVDYVLLFDNGSNNYDEIYAFTSEFQSEKILIFRSKSNKGIAYAENRLCQKAVSLNSKWILTLDHDTICPSNMIKTYLKYIKMKNVGIFCPVVVDKDIVDKNKYSSLELQEVKKCIQSGALVNLDIWKKVDGFDEWMFLDYVDFDFCYKLTINNYKIIKCNKVIIDHQLGHRKESRFAKLYIYLYKKTKFRIFKYLSYKNVFSPDRIYYVIRNKIYFIKKNIDTINKREEIRDLLLIIFKRIVRGENRLMIIKETFKGLNAGIHAKIEN